MVRAVSQDRAIQINSLLSKRLAEERVKRGISKKKLAEMAGMDRSTVAFIEDPAENPTIYNLLRYCLALEIDLGKTLSDIQSETQTPKQKRTPAE